MPAFDDAQTAAFELIALAAEADTLIGSLRAKLAEITAKEKEVHDNLVASGVAAWRDPSSFLVHAGRAGLVRYAVPRVGAPALSGQTVEALATAAWGSLPPVDPEA